ncbi:MAG TPA: ABC transporter ATP-binding protein [Candidatus Megaira endosymbiont of Nemacystus decipiens]|nr:ABC transporter ATP-binding protein [Candidatus Megaera endosymbiont of Nemacystus decipiens]
MFQKLIYDYQLNPSIYKIYKYFIYDGHKVKILILALIILMTGLVPVIDSYFLQNITDSIELYSDNFQSTADIVPLLFKWVVIYLLWWEGQNFMWRAYDYLYLKTLPQINANVIREFYSYIQLHGHDFFQSQLAGDITGRITRAADSIEMVFAHINEKIFRKSVVLFSTIIALYYIHFAVGIIFVVWLAIFISISLLFAKDINRYSVEFSKNRSRIAGKIVDSISNISVVRLFSAHRFERSILEKSLQKMVVSSEELQWFMLKLRYGLGLSCTIMIGCMIYYTLHLRTANMISTGQCVMIITLCIAVIDNVWDLTQEIGDLFEHIGAFNQSLTLLKGYDILDNKGAKDVEITNPSIEFRKVCFNYKENYNNFTDQSVFIPAYQKVGLAGFSGSGKTTFTRMITRVYNLVSGSILIGNHDIKDISLCSLNQKISVISQDPVLFHRTIGENISYGSHDISQEKIVEAARMAHIHDYIMQLPEGYDTICGERGNNLSGGQRQRVSIARAFLKQASILIIDEATSALDPHTEKLIQESLAKLMVNKTVIVIAHRLSTLLNMERILVFNKGHIVEDGTHEELLKRGQTYKMLWDHY